MPKKMKRPRDEHCYTEEKPYVRKKGAKTPVWCTEHKHCYQCNTEYKARMGEGASVATQWRQEGEEQEGGRSEGRAGRSEGGARGRCRGRSGRGGVTDLLFLL